MSKKKYVVQEVEGYSGLEFLSDSPVGRRRYIAGEEIELDDKVHDVVGLLGMGIVIPFKASAVKPEAAEADNTDKEG